MAVYNQFKERIEGLREELDEVILQGPFFFALDEMSEVATKIKALRIEVDNHPQLTKRKKARLLNAIDLTRVDCDYELYGIKLRLPGYDYNVLRAQRYMENIERNRLARESLALEKSYCVIQ